MKHEHQYEVGVREEEAGFHHQHPAAAADCSDIGLGFPRRSGE